MSVIRLFIAAELPDSIRDELSTESTRLQTRIRGKFVSPEHFHVTLAFLGEVNKDSILLISEILKTACTGHEPLDLKLGKLGFFGRRKSATLWQDFRESDKLQALGDGIRAKLAENGIAYDEKPFHPHVTLARKAIVETRMLTDYTGKSSGTIDTVTLFQSTTVKGEIFYRPLSQVVLTPSARR